MASLKEVRYPITALFALLVVTAVAVLSRWQLASATAQVETLVIAKLLQDVETDRVHFESVMPTTVIRMETQGEQREPAEGEAWWTVCATAFGKFGGAETIGQFTRAWHGYSKYYKASTYRTRMTGGGWLHFTVREPSDGDFARELSAKDSLRSTRQPSKSKDRPRSGGPCRQGRELFLAAVAIDKSDGKPSPIVSTSVDLVLSNIETKYDAQGGPEDALPGPIAVYVGDLAMGTQLEPMDREQVAAAVLERCRLWGIAKTVPEEAYLELRSMYERQQVSLPIFNVSVGSRSFLACAVAISVGLGAWASFLLRTLRHRALGKEDEPWILVEPVRQLHGALRWDRLPAAFEVLLFLLFHLVALSAPLTIALITLATGALDARQWVYVPLLLVGLLVSASSVVNYLAVVRLAWRADESPID